MGGDDLNTYGMVQNLVVSCWASDTLVKVPKRVFIFFIFSNHEVLGWTHQVK